MREDLRGTWPQALRTFLFPILLVLGVRWLIAEPFVIPSGSMIPTLLIHDHILVNKLRFGIKVPFTKSFLWQWSHPSRGDVVVFRFPGNPEVFYVKRVVAVAGDTLEVKAGELFINGEKIDQAEVSSAEPGFDYFRENNLSAKSGATHIVRYHEKASSFFHSVTIPVGQFFVMGDNRDQSNDSRYWGFVPEQNLIGSATYVWLACEKTLESANFLCDPQSISWQRVGLRIR